MEAAAPPISNVERTIAQVFYHPRTGFGSLEETLKAARAFDRHITRADVRAFLAKQELRQRKKPAKNEMNSYVAQLPRQEFQIDLMDQGEQAEPRYGFVAIDIFSKKAACFPIDSKTASETTAALKKTFDELGYPASIMSDEGGEFQGEFAQECRDQDIELIYSRTGGRFVERFIRTLKKALFERRQALGGNWTNYVQPVMDKYNDTVHKSIHAKPDYIAEHEYDFPIVARAHAWLLRHAKFPITHEKINVGDHVKIRLKQKAFWKETSSSWSSEVYTVERIEYEAPQGTLYYLTHYRRPLLRYELKKVLDVHRIAGGNLQSVLGQVRFDPAAAAAARAARAAAAAAPAAAAPEAAPAAPPEAAPRYAGVLDFLAAQRPAAAAPAPQSPTGLLGFLNRSRQQNFNAGSGSSMKP